MYAIPIQALYLEALARGLIKASVPDLAKELFPEQLAFVKDPSKRKAAHPGRRSGKTYCVAVYALMEAFKHEKSLIPYIAITKGHARRLMWPVLHELNDKYKLNLKFNETLLEARAPNGSKIWLTGTENLREVEKLRGDKYPIVFIDEIGSMPSFIDYLINDVLKYALMDYDGTVVVTGTPAPTCAGYFYEICKNLTKREWSVHHWTMLVNSKFPLWANKRDWKDLAKAFLQREKEEEGWSDDNPRMLRELFGMHVSDPDSLVYSYAPIRNEYEGGSVTFSNPQYVIGIDLGYEDLTTWTVFAFEPDKHPILYQVHEEGGSGMIVDDVAETTRRLIDKYDPDKVVADTGGLGKMIIEQLKQRHNMSIDAAVKAEKQDYIELMNSDMYEGRVKALVGSKLVEEWSNHQWEYDPTRSERDKREKCRKEASTPNHYCDAALYAWRYAYHWCHEMAEKVPDKGTKEYADYEADKIRQEKFNEIAQQQERARWKRRR